LSIYINDDLNTGQFYANLFFANTVTRDEKRRWFSRRRAPEQWHFCGNTGMEIVWRERLPGQGDKL